MDDDAFQRAASNMAEFITEYLKNVKDMPVTPSVAPGYLQQLLPANAPRTPDRWEDIMKDVQDKIIPGMTHWQHPHFHAYFPGGSSYPSLLAEMLTAGLGSTGFSWVANPVMSELETVMMEWIGRLMNLPKEFLPYTKGSHGGGVIQGSSSECTLVSMFAARTKAINHLKEETPEVDDCFLLAKLVAYFSEEAHSSVEKACDISFIKRRSMPTDDKLSMRGETLMKAIEIDEANGLIPFFVCGTVGTTGSTAVDNIEELGQICHEKNIWLHVDGAYGGNALICPEYHYLLRGFEYVSSFNYNPIKWMHVGVDCSPLWVRDRRPLLDALAVNRRQRIEEDKHMIDYQHAKLAKLFKSLAEADDRFEVLNDVVFGLVCFRLKGENKLTESLLQQINQSAKAHMIPTTMKGRYVIRYTPPNWHFSEDFTRATWAIVTEQADAVLRRHRLAAERFQKLLGKYKDYARAQREKAAAGGKEEEEPGEIRDEVSWGAVLHNLGYRFQTEGSLRSKSRLMPPGGKKPNAFRSLRLKFDDDEPAMIKRQSEALFS